MLELTTESRNDITIVSLKGFIDAFSCQKFEESFDQLLAKSNYKIVVDLSKVDYMSSVGAGIFIAVHCVAAENKGIIVLVNPKSKVREIFQMLGMCNMISFTDTIDNAIKLIEQHSPARS